MIGEGVEREQEERDERKREDWEQAAATGNAYALLASLAASEDYSEARSGAVVALAMAVGRRLGLGTIQLVNLHWVALLHDVGKLGISSAILGKPGELTEEEWVELRRHADIGERIIASTPDLAHLAPSIRAEHERWDGTGYPDGLTGSQIPLISRIVFVSDAYNAMTSKRPFRLPLTPAAARAELEATPAPSSAPRSRPPRSPCSLEQPAAA